jgi:hypothetical protein
LLFFPDFTFSLLFPFSLPFFFSSSLLFALPLFSCFCIPLRDILLRRFRCLYFLILGVGIEFLPYFLSSLIVFLSYSLFSLRHEPISVPFRPAPFWVVLVLLTVRTKYTPTTFLPSHFVHIWISYSLCAMQLFPIPPPPHLPLVVWSYLRLGLIFTLRHFTSSHFMRI